MLFDIADYVLEFRGQKLAVVEAKKVGLSVTEGLAQAKRYASRLQTRFAYSTNGKGIYQVDMLSGQEGPVEKYPSPGELWDATFETKRKVCELLRKEVRVGRADGGTTTLNIVYYFSKDLIEADAEDVQLCSSRMPLWLLRRPFPAMYLPSQLGLPLSETY